MDHHRPQRPLAGVVGRLHVAALQEHPPEPLQPLVAPLLGFSEGVWTHHLLAAPLHVPRYPRQVAPLPPPGRPAVPATGVVTRQACHLSAQAMEETEVPP